MEKKIICKLVCLLTYVCGVLITACQHHESISTNEEGDTISLRYARNLTMVQYENRLEVFQRNPWDTSKILNHYTIVQEKGKYPNEVLVPLKKAAVFTSVHCALLQELGVETSIGGVYDLQYIHLPFITQKVKAGSILDLGNAMNPNIELVMELHPDALMPNPFENSGGYGRLEQLGIPIIECADYMEVSPLARAEWMRFYGRLFGVGKEADSLFLQIEQRYLSLCEKALQAKTHPKLICDIPYSGQWMLPGHESTMGQMYNDAGADYVFNDLKGAGSIPLSIEHVLDRALTSDIWIFKHHGPITRKQIYQDTPLLKDVPASMWFCDTSTSGFYEETPFHPERLLANLVQILHPELGIQAEKAYFCSYE